MEQGPQEAKTAENLGLAEIGSTPTIVRTNLKSNRTAGLEWQIQPLAAVLALVSRTKPRYLCS